jgi:hypothetical protein
MEQDSKIVDIADVKPGNSFTALKVLAYLGLVLFAFLMIFVVVFVLLADYLTDSITQGAHEVAKPFVDSFSSVFPTEEVQKPPVSKEN